MNQWKYNWITDWDEVWSKDFQSQWYDWMDIAENSHVFFHPSMVKAWVETYLPIRKITPMFLVAKKEDYIVFFPLVLWKMNWKNVFLRKIIPVGYSDFDYNTPILVGKKEGFDWKAFWKALMDEINDRYYKTYDYLEFSGIQEECWKENDLFSNITKEWCPYINLAQHSSYDDFIVTVKSSERTSINRRRRRLESLGNLDFKIFTQFDDANATLNVMLKHHSKRWPNSYKAKDFHKNLIKRCLKSGILHFSALKLEEEYISWKLGFIYKNKYYSYVPAFIESYSKYAPSKINSLLCIKDAIFRKCEIFDLLRGEEAYKKKSAERARAVYNIKIKNVQKKMIFVKHAILKIKRKVVDFMSLINQRGGK
jgi:CelD/BcsL family acetyltransferase involved in cellulose biosynthesis